MQALELKLPPPVIAGLLALGMWLLAMRTPSLAFDLSVRVPLALACVAGGLAVDALGLLAFLRARTTINPLRPGATAALVTTGVYRFTRNPMYLGLLLLLTGWALYVANYAAMLGVPVFVLYVTRFQIAPEERILAEKFGAAYADYRCAVRRWL